MASASPPGEGLRGAHVVSACAIALLTTWTGVVRAQSETALDRFEPPPPADPSSVFPGAGVTGELAPSFGASLVYANGPLVLVDEATGEKARAVVEHQLVLHVLASLSIASRALIDVDVPTSLVLAGDDATANDARFGAPAGARFDDLRIGGRFEVLEQDGWAPSAAFAVAVWFPTGDEGAYTSTGSVRFAPSVSVSGDYGSWLFGVTAARRFERSRASDENLLGSDVEISAGAGGRIDRFTFGGALLTGFVTPDSMDEFRRRAAVRIELLAEARAKLGPVDLALFGGPGFTRSPGTPLFRLGLAGTVGFDALGGTKSDRVEDRGASSRDTSGAHTDERSRPRPDAGPHKQPPPAKDTDGDGLADALDACPDVPGPIRGAPTDGCPLDTDGDHIPDPQDACPREPGPASAEATKNGCPEGAKVEGERIAIFTPIEFATGKADLLPSSETVLTRVAAILAAHPEIARVAVDGHTDGKGSPQKNLELSRAR
ncbi:MAG TPA: thrombospondin type 3 repeat-containing protein, partial [Polyangiaceae bacterium]|nr:thrombospondin type 3 repeat-containing protein [Polyangiaceae bacterium]